MGRTLLQTGGNFPWQVNFAKHLKDKIKYRLDVADSAKGNRITEAILSGTIDAYSAQSGANQIFASAHQNRIHISEQHPDVIYEDQKPDRDLTLSGGNFKLVEETETSGGPKAVAADFEKIKNDDPSQLKCLATRARSPKQQGQYEDKLKKASKEDGGCYIGVEVQLPKGKKSSTAAVKTVCFSAGRKLYED